MTPEANKCPYRGLAPPPGLRQHVLCGWTVGPHTGGSETELPDGSIDIVWLEGEAPTLAGPATGPVPSARPAGSTVVGASFRPGAAPAMLGIPANELRDLRVPLSEAWGADAKRLEQSLDGGEPPSARVRLIEEVLRLRLKRAEPPDRLVAAAVARLRGPGPSRVDAMMLALARHRAGTDLGQLAVDAGYADQAHMTAECTRLGGVPPARLLAERYLLRMPRRCSPSTT